MNRGEIWWVEHPEGGRRPHLILSRQAAIPLLNSLLAVPATTNVRGIPTELPLDEDDGMPAPCALSFDNIRTVRTAHCTERITMLGVERLEQACRVLRVATGC